MRKCRIGAAGRMRKCRTGAAGRMRKCRIGAADRMRKCRTGAADEVRRQGLRSENEMPAEAAAADEKVCSGSLCRPSDTRTASGIWMRSETRQLSGGYQSPTGTNPLLNCKIPAGLQRCS
ncbi:MAG: hypothetical protein PHE06_13355 [Lachnospiraceae bacterium]|nr:hypothetical protein [Lachnospiraceae bacterium]